MPNAFKLRSIGQFLFLLLLIAPGTQFAATLKPDTVAAWESYVQAARIRMQERLLPGHRLLVIDEEGGMAEKVRSGKPVISPVGQTPKKIADGLIHDWVGTAFIPKTDINVVLSTVRDYRHYKDFYHPAVIVTNLLDSGGMKDRFSMLLTSKSLGLREALDGDYSSTYVSVDSTHWYSISETTRVQEIEHYGTPQQRTLPEREGNGFVWKLLSINCFEQRDDGVYVEVEAIALSRDIPSSVRWVATSIVRKLSRASLLTSLQQTTDAVHSRTAASIPALAREQHGFQAQAGAPTATAVHSFR